METPLYKEKELSDQKKIPAVRKFSWYSDMSVEDFVESNDRRFFYLYLGEKGLTGDSDEDLESRKEDMVAYYTEENRDYTKRLMCRCYMNSLQEDYDFLDEPVCE